MTQLGIIGGGAWGTALAAAGCRAGSDILLWARESEVVSSINTAHENKIFLPGIELPEGIKATSELKDLTDCDIIVLVPPAQYMASTCEQLRKVGLKISIPLVICSKGIERNSLRLMSEVVESFMQNPIAVLTGPTFATEVAKKLPVFVTLAANDKTIIKNISAAFESENMKIRPIDDIIGAQIGGAVKNVIAIACGIVEGKGLGENAKAALITGGAKEIEQLTVAKGGKHETVMRLCGIGDLILTCNSKQSRNFSLGYALGQGKTLKQATDGKSSVAEGVESSESVYGLAEKLGIKLPICDSVRRIISGENADKVISELIAIYR